jgi:Carboxypeptidase regulatory-like domain
MLSPSALAQVQNGQIIGVIADPFGAVVAHSSVDIRDLATGYEGHFESNDAGIYTIPELIVGSYAIRVAAPGFKTVRATNLLVTAGSVLRVDFNLVLGQRSETVEVSDAARPVNTESSRLSYTVDSAQIANLPLNGRNVYDLHCQELLEERALAHDSMDATEVRKIREDMERAEARRLQPHFIESFFLEAFRVLGGSIKEREPHRFEITHVPALIRQRDRLIGIGEPVLLRYERITFEKSLRAVPGQPLATFVSPGHPLLAATIDLVLDRNRDLLKRGAVLVDPDDPGQEIRALFYLEHTIQDGRIDKAGNHRAVSRQLQFIEIDSTGTMKHAGYAPYLDYRATTSEEHAAISPELESQVWLKTDLESAVVGHAIETLVPQHIQRGQLASQRPRDTHNGCGQRSTDERNQLLGPPRQSAQGPGTRATDRNLLGRG